MNMTAEENTAYSIYQSFVNEGDTEPSASTVAYLVAFKHYTMAKAWEVLGSALAQVRVH